ncbi:unnamed protein product [Sphagnum jensenii]|uniref:Uncharacterized protein n=1 Tax=Sphagnum jensenii TaxID=128206 RepID=A0ABP1ACA0_9BRYO
MPRELKQPKQQLTMQKLNRTMLAIICSPRYVGRMAGQVKLNNLGMGVEQPGEVTAEDDIFEQYKKRMMLGYHYCLNPLNNPWKAYY